MYQSNVDVDCDSIVVWSSSFRYYGNSFRSGLAGNVFDVGTE